MGTDIDLYIEELVEGKWKLKRDEDGTPYCPYDVRSYDDYSILCGVRDYYKAIPITYFDDLRDIDPETAELFCDWSGTGFYCEGCLTFEDIESYEHWDTPFPDTRRPAGHTGGLKCGGISGHDFSDEYYEKSTPRETMSFEFEKLIEIIREGKGKLRAVFTFW